MGTDLWLVLSYLLVVNKSLLKYSHIEFWSGNLEMRQQIQYFHNSEKSVKNTTYDCKRTMVCPQYNTS
jgi:hypothetical protein